MDKAVFHMEDEHMTEKNVLEPQEVEAMIKAAQSVESNDMDTDDNGSSSDSKINTNAFNSILEITRSTIETRLTAMMRTKVIVDNKPHTVTTLEEVTNKADNKNIYLAFRVEPYETPLLICTEHAFLDGVINLLYGGQSKNTASADAPLGKIGKITAEKISEIVISCVAESCNEYGKFVGKHYKTSENINSVNILPDKELYTIDFAITYNEQETNFSITLPEEFFVRIIPMKTGAGRHREKDFWRNAIKGEVIDSYVTVSTTISDAKIKLNDLAQLKVGDEIPIEDPTLVFICLNRLKLFRALAGQSNDKVVAKIVSQI